jgi:hypothetical protein
MTAGPVIVVDPEVTNGTPCFRGTRVSFKNLIDYLEGGHPLLESRHLAPATINLRLGECAHSSGCATILPALMDGNPVFRTIKAPAAEARTREPGR